MICSKCQTVNPDDAVFCEECGARMPSEGTVVCPKCQTVNPADTVFCEECGARVPSEDTVVCPNCQTVNPADTVFCEECGSRFGEPPAADDVLLCPKCQTANPANASFCSECGTRFGEPPTVEEPEKAAPFAQEDAKGDYVEEESSKTAPFAHQDAETDHVAEESASAASFAQENIGTSRVAEEPAKTAAYVREGMGVDHIGPYELRGELGRGAMARVWRAWDPNLQVERAIKEPIFNPNLPQSTLDEMGRRFVAEGRAAARLNHPNIVTIHAADVYSGRPAIVMELVDGMTLAELLQRGPLTPPETLSVLDQLLDAVQHAHENGIVHRDIKPDNIFISSRGEVKLADFGIAHVAESGANRSTMVGTVLGTPGYMSPEQATGRPVDARSDIFSIGAVAYEMITGRNPFGADDGSDATTLLYRIVHEPVPELPEDASEGLPTDLRPAIMAALAKEPQNRPQTASEFKAMLHGQRVAPATGIRAQVLADAVSGKSGKLPKWAPYVAVAAIAVVVLVGVFVSASNSGGGGMGGSTTVAEKSASVVSSYLAPAGEYVAIFASNNSNTPYQITRLKVNDLSPEIVAELGSHNTYASVDEAAKKVDEWQKAVDDAAAAKEKAAKESASTKSAAKKTAEVNEVKLTCTGADGKTRTETVRRKGNTERVIPDSNTRKITDDEIKALSDAERCIAYNEIIASATGYSFKNSGLSDYFKNNCKSWYVARDGSGGTDGLSAEAQDNVKRLQKATDSWWKDLAAS